MRHWLPPTLWAALIFMGSSVPDNQIPGQVSMMSRVLHVVEYAVFAYLLGRSWQKTKLEGSYWKIFANVLMIAVVYGMTDEIHQAFVSGRQADSMDLIADAAGSVIGVTVWHFWKK